MTTQDRSAAASPDINQLLYPPAKHRMTDSPTQMESNTPEVDEAHNQELCAAVQNCEIFLNDKLPQAVQASLGSWTKGANSLAVIMVLFAGVQMTLIQLVIQQDQQAQQGVLADPALDINSDPTQSLPWRVMRWFMYAGVLVDLGGTASAIAIVNMSSAAPIMARTAALREFDSLPRKVLDGAPIEKELLMDDQEILLLRKFGVSKWFNRVGWHMLISFMFGSLFILISLCIWIWVREPTPVAAALMPIVLIAIVPVYFVGFGD